MRCFGLIFISLIKDRKRTIKEMADETTKMLGELHKKDIKILGFY